MIIILELRKREQLGPVILPLIDKEPEVLLQFLVHPLCLPIPLRVISGGSSQFDSEHAVELPRELRNELRTSVRDDLPGEPVMPPDLLKEETCGTRCGDGGKCRGEVGPLCDRVDYHHYGVVTRRFRKLDYKVHADRFPRCGGDRKGVEFTDRKMSLSFGAEAEVTGGDVLAYVPRHLRPPVVA